MTLYWYSESNNDWDTLTNWWEDEDHTIPASSIPVDGDSVYFLGSVAPTTGPTTVPLTLVNFYTLALQAAFNIDCSQITVSNLGIGLTDFTHYFNGTTTLAAVYSNGAFAGVANGDCTFSGTGINKWFLQWQCYF